MATLNPYDKLLESKNLRYEDLTAEEKQAYIQASKDIKSVSVEDMHEHVKDMLYNMVLDLCNTPDTEEHRDTNSKLKARAKNYLLLDAFISMPHKTAENLRRQLESNNN